MAEQRIICGDSMEVLKGYPDNYFDGVVTDPPYGLSFMGKKWDYDVPCVELWKEVLRVLKPGGHILCACGTRTQHRMAVNIEDAGFEIRDVITWHYGSGFPKSLDISKAIDKAAGVERTEVIGISPTTGKRIEKSAIDDEESRNKGSFQNKEITVNSITAPVTQEAKQWNGFGTALKPACELFTLARKPIEGNVAKNVLKWGVGGLNIDGCRIKTQDDTQRINKGVEWGSRKDEYYENREEEVFGSTKGRFPANVIFSHHPDCIYEGTKKIKGTSTGNGDAEKGEESKGAIKPIRRGEFTDRTDENGLEEVESWKCHPDCPIKIIDKQSGVLKSGKAVLGTGTIDCQNNGIFGSGKGGIITSCFADEGGASRFFYCAKASKNERNKGLENIEIKNGHPTVKPVKLMQYLTRLITPPGGIVLDPFNGSGTTGIACKLEGFNYVGIEREEEYCKISRARIDGWVEEMEYEKQINASSKKEEKAEDEGQLNFFEE